MAKWKNYWSAYSGLNYKLVALILITLFSALYFLTPPKTEQPAVQQSTQTLPTETNLPARGELVITLKDARQKLIGLGYATALNITVKSIQIHTAEDNTTDNNITAEGWITIFNGTKTLDLLEYTDVSAIVGEKELEPAKYTQVRLYLSEEDSTIKIYNAEIFIFNKTYALKVPSNVIKLTHPFTIELNKTTVLTFDFDVPQSITRTADGYMLKPTIKISEEMIGKGERPANSKAV